jgi:hypothetical protein
VHKPAPRIHVSHCRCERINRLNVYETDAGP